MQKPQHKSHVPELLFCIEPKYAIQNSKILCFDIEITILCQKLNKNVLNPKYLDDAAGLKVQTIN